MAMTMDSKPIRNTLFGIVALLSVHLAAADTQWVRQAPTSLERRWNGIYGLDLNHAWVVGSRETVVETKDGGVTWTVHHTSSIDSSPFNAVAFSDALTGFVAGNFDSTLFTSNGGTTWAKASGFQSAIGANFIDFVSPTNAFAVYGGAVYRTTNSGGNWAPVQATQSINQYSADFRDDQVGLVGGDDNLTGPGIYKTVDGGVTWSRKHTNASNALIWLSTNTALAFDQQSVLRSTDAGETWHPFGVIDTASIVRVSRFGYTDSLAAITAEGAIYRSTNLGQTWTQVKIGLGHPLFPDRLASIHCANANVAWAVSDPGCIFRSIDQGATWQQVSSSGTVSITDLKMHDSSFGIAVGHPNYIMTTHDGGNKWLVSKHSNQEITATHEETLTKIDIVDANFAVAAGKAGSVFKTLDGGSTWSPIGNPLLDEQFDIFAIDFTDANTGWVAGYDYSFGFHMNNLFKTTNGGASWVMVRTNTESQGFFQSGGFGDMYWIDASRGFLTGTNSDPMMVRTIDGGVTWNHIDLPTMNGAYINDIQFRGESEGWIVGALGYVLKSTDAGATWAKLNVGTSLNGFTKVVFPGHNKVWLFGAEHFTQRPMVYKSADGGSTWASEYIGNFPYVAQAASALPDGNVWFATGMGTIHKAALSMLAQVPAQITVIEGPLVGGTVASLSRSDNFYVTLRRPAEPSLRSMQIEATVVTNPAQSGPFILNIESRCIGTIASEIVELYDWPAQTWERVIIYGPSSSDSTYDVRIVDRPERFIQPGSGQVKVRLTCRQEQPAFTPTWEYLIDEIKVQSDTVPVGFGPTAIERLVGSSGSGSLAEILQSDNQYVQGGFSWVIARDSPNLVWAVEAVAPTTTVSSLDLIIEGKASLAGLQQQVQLRNVQSGLWETVDISTTSTVDTTRTISVSNAARFAAPGGIVSARLNFRPGGQAGRVITVSLDYLRFRAYP